jgi:four helix bundle protein
MQDFKDVKVWQKAHEMTLFVYKITDTFPKEEKFGLVSQMRRAMYSIPLNIVEGCGRKTTKDKANFFQISFASAQEVQYINLLCKDLKFLSQADFEVLENNISEIKAMIVGFMKKLNETVSK